MRIDQKRKKELTKLAGSRKRSVRVVGKIEHILYFISVFGTLVFVAVALLNKQIFMEEVSGVVRKQYFFISLYGNIIFCVFLFFGVLAHFLKLNLQSANTEERIEEKVTLTDDTFIYTFRIRYQSGAKDRSIVVIPFDGIQKIDYYFDEGKLCICGSILSDYLVVDQIEALENFETLRDHSEGEFIIYDYFKPSLVESLKKKGLKIEVH